jgi:peptidoglycan hydrolase CwlO-like protein
MNRISILAILAALMLCFSACNYSVSKQFNAMQEDSTAIETKINEITDCDELQMMNFAILGLRSDMDNYRQESEMTEAEIGKLDDMIDKLEATWNGKWTSLGCKGNLMEGEFDTSGEEAGDFDYNVL